MYQKYRTSLERHNAPFRGTTDRQDAVNFDLALIHDLKHIQRISGGTDFPGHKQFIDGNLSTLYYNEGDITASIPTSAELYYKISTIDKPIGTWNTRSGGQLSLTNATTQHYELKASTHQGGVVTQLKLNPGDIISIRVEVESLTNSSLQFAIGSTQFNNEEHIDRYTLADFYDKKRYIEKRLVSNTTQDVEIGIFGIFGQEGNSRLSLRNPELSYLYSKNSTIEGIDTKLRQNLNIIESNIQSLQRTKEVFR